ncbi:MAG: type and secretion system protein, secretin [Deltaproteobacteria bacterium]|nr:type and secretion system protein, secretin [Deltaproteobacteria bacterium]
MITPLRLSGRIFRPRVMQGMAALTLACLLIASPVSAAEPAGARMKELVVSKTPYNTTIQAVVEGAIGNYNSFKTNDPFRIVVDIWGVAQGTVASDIPVDTPQVKGVKVSSQDGKIRMVVETPGGKPLPFMVNTDKNGLILSVGGGSEEKVTSTDRLQGDKAPPSGVAVVGIDLEDLPDVSNVVVTTAGDPSHQVTRGGDSVTLTFPGTSVEKALLRQIDAGKFEIPVKKIVPSAGKKGASVAVMFAPGSTYTVDKKGNTVVVSFAKAPGAAASDLVARAVAKPAEMMGTEEAAVNGGSAPGSQQWGFLKGVSGPDRKYKGQRISLDFKDAELSNIFRIIADVSNLNVITTDEVKGKVTLRLINVPWDQALDIILRSKGLGAVQEGNILRIAPTASIQREEQERLNAQKTIEMSKVEAMSREEETRTLREGVFDTIPVSYSRASELLAKVKPQVSKFAKLDSDDRTNVLIVKDLPQNIESLKKLVARLDTATPQVLIEARIVEVDTTFTRELGVQWGGNYTGTSGGTQYGIGGMNSTAINATTTTPYSPIAPAAPNLAVNLPAAIGQGSGGGIAFGILRDNLRLDLALSALESSGKAKIVSSPKVVTVDNKEALIEQGTQIPYSTVSASGTNTQFIDATLSLKVTPHITPDGRVSMKLEAKNDSQGETSPTGQPAINKKKATTEVLIGDGDTTVIGGILQISRTENTSGLPWLSKIPVLGYFFRKDTNTARNRELLIFITPKIIKAEPIQPKGL